MDTSDKLSGAEDSFEDDKHKDDELDLEMHKGFNRSETSKIDKRQKKGKKAVQILSEEERSKIYENIEIVQKNMEDSETKKLQEVLKRHFFFGNLSHEEIDMVIKNMFYAETQKESYVFKQHDNGSCFFVVSQGSVDVIIDGQTKKTLNQYDYFGELALMYDAPRSADIYAKEKCCFWAINKKAFTKVYSEIVTKVSKENQKFLETVALFSNLTEQQKTNITAHMISEKFVDGEMLVNKGDQADSYFIIKEGSVECILDDGKVVREIIAGETFGEAALYADAQKRSQSVRAKGEVSCIAIAKNGLLTALGDNIDLVIASNEQRWSLGNHKIFNHLTKLQTEKWIQSSELVSYKEGDLIYKKGQHLKKIFIVIEGTVHDTTNDKDYGTKKLFGVEYCYPKIQLKKKAFCNLEMKTDGKLGMIELATLKKIMGDDDVHEVLSKNRNSHEKRLGKVDVGFRKEVEGLNLKDLIYIKKLGEGQFGDVYCVYSKQLNSFYALKSVSREKIVQFSIQTHIQQEKEVLEMLNFPLIIKLYRTFQDDNRIYFQMSLVQGVELFDAIRLMDFLNNEQATFYVGQMILSLEYLHGFNIVYRDLKPENIMVNNAGQLILIDMGTAKKIGTSKDTDGPQGRTYTILGTPHYMAPEILLGKGYGLTVDLWSIGVCLYEFMIGQVPFGDDFEEPYDVYQAIVSSQLSFPEYFLTKENKQCAKIMQQLMKRSPEQRHGGDYAKLKAHEWLKNVDWDGLVEQTVKAPMCPPETAEIDHTNSKTQIEEAVSIVDILDRSS